MNFLELTRARYSVRSYSDRQVEKEKLDRILEAGKNAPTAANKQPQVIYVIQSDEARAKVKKFTRSHYNAPCFLLVCYDQDESWFGLNNDYGRTEGSIDATIVATHMILEATEQGLGSVWVEAFNPAITREEFSIPDNIVPVALIVIGYPSDESEPFALHDIRKDLSETVRYV